MRFPLPSQRLRRLLNNFDPLHYIFVTFIQTNWAQQAYVSLVDFLIHFPRFSRATGMMCRQEQEGTWSGIKQTSGYRQAGGNSCVDAIDWWNFAIYPNPSISRSWYLAESLGFKICSPCSFKFVSVLLWIERIKMCQTCHFSISCWQILCSFLIFFSQRSWWTLRQKRLISNGPSSQPPNLRYVIPASAYYLYY